VADISSDPARVAEELIPVAKQMRKHDEPDVLILGCTDLSMAEICVKSKWLHSSKTYPAPSSKHQHMPEGYDLYYNQSQISQE
jgi:hypothetical protein